MQPLVRATDPQTSHDAAAGVDLIGSQRLVWLIFEKLGHGIADHELIDWSNFYSVSGAMSRRYSPQRLRTARAELVEKGILRDSGRIARTEYGRDAVVWEMAA